MLDQRQKTLVSCSTQDHAARVRNAINQIRDNPDPHYCEQVSDNDGKLGEQRLREFQDNEKMLPTILTTSRKLSPGVDARNVRNIVLLRPITPVIEFKQIIVRGTRTFDGVVSTMPGDCLAQCRRHAKPSSRFRRIFTSETESSVGQ